MTVPATRLLRPLGAGEMLDAALGLFKGRFVPLGTMTFLCLLPATLATAGRLAAGGERKDTRPETLLYNLGTVVAWAGAVWIVSEAYFGRRAGLRDGLAAGGRRLWSLIGLQIVTGLAVGLATLLFIVPGVVVFGGLSAAIQVLVLEPQRDVSGAISRSWALTRGRRIRMAGLFLLGLVIVGVAVVGVMVVLAVTLSALADLPDAALDSVYDVLMPGVFVPLLLPYVSALMTVAYYDLRVRQEGFDLEFLSGAAS